MKQTKIIRSYRTREKPQLKEGERIITSMYVPEYKRAGSLFEPYIEYTVEYDTISEAEEENRKLKEEIKKLKEEIKIKSEEIERLRKLHNPFGMSTIVLDNGVKR